MKKVEFRWWRNSGVQETNDRESFFDVPLAIVSFFMTLASDQYVHHIFMHFEGQSIDCLFSNPNNSILTISNINSNQIDAQGTS